MPLLGSNNTQRPDYKQTGKNEIELKRLNERYNCNKVNIKKNFVGQLHGANPKKGETWQLNHFIGITLYQQQPSSSMYRIE